MMMEMMVMMMMNDSDTRQIYECLSTAAAGSDGHDISQ